MLRLALGNGIWVGGIEIEALDDLRLKNPRLGALSRSGPLARAWAAGAAGPRRGAGGLVVVRLSLKRVVPGSVPPWRAPCFAWPRCGFGLPGVDFRAPAVVFHFRAKTWF